MCMRMCICRCEGVQVCRCEGVHMRMHMNMHMHMCMCMRMCICRCAGMQGRRGADVQVCRCAGCKHGNCVSMASMARVQVCRCASMASMAIMESMASLASLPRRTRRWAQYPPRAEGRGGSQSRARPPCTLGVLPASWEKDSTSLQGSQPRGTCCVHLTSLDKFGGKFG